MPIPLIAEVVAKGPSAVPGLPTLLRALPWLTLLGLLKYYFGGARNVSDRPLHGKVVIVTGGFSGIGASLAQSLASRGAQIILLTQQPPADPFVTDYIEDLRAATSNELIYAEQVDLGSLHSIRLFATRWIDNTPPRRLDTIVLCAATMTPRFSKPVKTYDGLEPCWGINYLANFQLLNILSPALRAQPPDRDVRIVIATCAGYVGGDLKSMRHEKSPLPNGREYETSKLALMSFGYAFQEHLDAYKRPDKKSNNARVVIVDPGYSRTPGMRRWLSMGALWGLLIYLILWPLWWLVLKSPEMGAQSLLRAVMEVELGRGQGGNFLKECKEAKLQRPEAKDGKVAKELWSFSEKQIAALEKEDAVKRKLAAKAEEQEKRQDQSHKKPQDAHRGEISASSTSIDDKSLAAREVHSKQLT